MSTQADKITVSIGELQHEGWTQYEIDSDLMTPADAWRVRLAQPVIELPAEVVEGAPVVVRMNGETVLKGIIDDKEVAVSAGQHELMLSGRDRAGILLDCSAPIFVRSEVTLEQLVANMTRDLIKGVNIRIDAPDLKLREKVNIEPGDSAWDSLRRAAEANGLWPWFEPDGTLVVGGPRYDLPPVAALTMRADGRGNNVLSLRERRSIVERFSRVTVLGQRSSSGYGSGESDPRNNIRGSVEDTGVVNYRPRIVSDHEAVNEDIARARAYQIISESRVKSYTLVADVRGHRTDDGVLWTPGQRVVVKSEPHGLDGVYFLMARRFTGDKNSGQRTQLTLKEDGVWVPQPHPSKRRHRRGMNSLPGKIVDLTRGATP